jgi:HAD superfamily hydrolase (TIGR01509 family)
VGLEALIFDVDGTLAETEELHRRAFNEAFAACDLAWFWDESLYRELLGVTGGKERILHYVAQRRPQALAAIAPRVPEIHRLKTERYTALLKTGAVQLRPGIARLIVEARRAGLRVAIATTTSHPAVTALLRSAFPRDDTFFDAIAAGDEARRKKPWPDVYTLVLQRLGLPAGSCVAFEDSAAGVLAARSAGIAVLATPSAYTGGDDLSGALSVVSDLGEPGAPHRPLAGVRWDAHVVTLDGLRRWHRACKRGDPVRSAPSRSLPRR